MQLTKRFSHKLNFYETRSQMTTWTEKEEPVYVSAKEGENTDGSSVKSSTKLESKGELEPSWVSSKLTADMQKLPAASKRESKDMKKQLGSLNEPLLWIEDRSAISNEELHQSEYTLIELEKTTVEMKKHEGKIEKQLPPKSD
eukprot:Gb_04747 [translate_table: standard]